MDFWTTEQRGHVAVATFSNPPYNFVTREVFDELGQVVAGFTAVTQLNRKDFGLNWNMALEAGGFLVGDNATIEIELEAVREDPAPVADSR